MRALQEQAERVGREAAARRVDALVEQLAAKLPRAVIDKMTTGLSISGRRLLDRWMGDPDLRFLTRSGQ